MTVLKKTNLKLLETGNLEEIKGLQGKYITILRFCLDNPKKLIVFTFAFSNFYTNFLWKVWERL